MSSHNAFSLADKVAALRQPDAYPQPVDRVECIETHMSWVFLAGDEAWKLKKPVRHEHLDFRTMSARRFYCLEELRLNRALAPHVYLGVVPLRASQNHLWLDREGVEVDWLVRMRRLPAGGFLDARLARGAGTAAATPGDIAADMATHMATHMAAVAALLCGFYRAQPPVALGTSAYLALLQRHSEEDERELMLHSQVLPPGQVQALGAAQRRALEQAAPLLAQRLAAGRVVEGHGDLRPEHVFLGPPLAIIDRLEFSAELRTLDAADEVAFLALECEHSGAAALGAALLQAWRAQAADDVPAHLLHLYRSCRASVRARLAAAHLHEGRYRESPRWPRRVREYFRLAQRHLLRATPALLRPAVR